MAFFATPKTTQVSALAATTATKAPTTAQGSRQLLKIFNDDPTASIFFGDSTVTDSKGIPIPPGGESDWIPCSGDIYVYSVLGGFTARAFEGA